MLGDQLDLWASHTSLPLSSVRSSVLARRWPPERSCALAAAGSRVPGLPSTTDTRYAARTLTVPLELPLGPCTL